MSLCCCLLSGLCLNANAVSLDDIANDWTTKGYEFEKDNNSFSDGKPHNAVGAENGFSSFSVGSASLLAASGPWSGVTSNNSWGAGSSVLSDNWISKEDILNCILTQHYNKTGVFDEVSTVNDLFIVGVCTSSNVVYYIATLKTTKYAINFKFVDGLLTFEGLSGRPIVCWAINSNTGAYNSFSSTYGLKPDFGTFTASSSSAKTISGGTSGEYTSISYTKNYYYKSYDFNFSSGVGNICSNTAISESRNNLFKVSGNYVGWGTSPYPTPETYSEQREEERHSGLLGAISSLGDKIGGFFTSLKDGLINGIKSLFVPSGDFWEGFKTEMDTFLSQHLGFVWQAISFFPRVINYFIEFFTDDLSNSYISLPSAEFDFFEQHYVLWEAETFYFDNILSTWQPLNILYTAYTGLLNGLFLYWIYVQAKMKYEWLMFKKQPVSGGIMIE